MGCCCWRRARADVLHAARWSRQAAAISLLFHAHTVEGENLQPEGVNQAGPATELRRELSEEYH